MTRRTLALLVAAALAVPACSASGDDDTISTPSSVVDGTTTTAAGGTTTTEPTPVDPDQVLVDSVDATLALTRFDATSVTDLRLDDQKVRLDVDAAVDYEARIVDADLEVSAPTGDNTVVIRADGTKVWVKASTVRVPEGKTWLEGKATLLDGSNFEPGGILGTVLLLRAATDTTVENESEEIDGVDTTVYRTSFTYDDAVDAAGDDAAVLKAALSLTWRDPVDLDVTAWIDADGIIRRLNVEVDPDDDTPLEGTFDLDLSTPDEIEPPEAPSKDDVLTSPKSDPLMKQVFTSS